MARPADDPSVPPSCSGPLQAALWSLDQGPEADRTVFDPYSFRLGAA